MLLVFIILRVCAYRQTVSCLSVGKWCGSNELYIQRRPLVNIVQRRIHYIVRTLHIQTILYSLECKLANSNF